MRSSIKARRRAGVIVDYRMCERLARLQFETGVADLAAVAEAAQ
jgi:hypothetical protein